jgi:hypothetical protein
MSHPKQALIAKPLMATPLRAILGAALLVVANFSQAASITAAASFDLAGILTSNASSITPLEFEVSVETPFNSRDETAALPVFASLENAFVDGSALAVVDAAATDSATLMVSADAFDTGFSVASLAYTFSFEVETDGAYEISVPYSAFYELDGSTIADTLVSLIINDSLGGFDETSLLPGDPAFAFGTLTASGVGVAGEIGEMMLLASVGADTGVQAKAVPAPGTLVAVALGLAGLFGARRRSATPGAATSS